MDEQRRESCLLSPSSALSDQLSSMLNRSEGASLLSAPATLEDTIVQDSHLEDLQTYIMHLFRDDPDTVDDRSPRPRTRSPPPVNVHSTSNPFPCVQESLAEEPVDDDLLRRSPIPSWLRVPAGTEHDILTSPYEFSPRKRVSQPLIPPTSSQVVGAGTGLAPSQSLESSSEPDVTGDDVRHALNKLDLRYLTDIIPGMTISLLPHQIIGVSWMVEREESSSKGGCLADDMGLGKTIQTIAMMIKNRPRIQAHNKTTLIIVPLSLLSQWQQEIASKTDGSCQVLLYHGSRRLRNAEAIREFDVVITTLPTLVSETPVLEVRRPTKATKSKSKTASRSTVGGVLFSIHWLRIILDEAQTIKNRNTVASRAVHMLDSTYRWALTGTPIVNSLQDAYGIVRFLRIEPWDQWKVFKRHIMENEQSDPTMAAERLQAIFNAIQLRRKKDAYLNGRPIIVLPPRNVKIVKLDFSIEERAVYQRFEEQHQLDFNSFMRDGSIFKNYHHILLMILRLRQLCSHPSLAMTEGAIPIHEGPFKVMGDEHHFPVNDNMSAEVIGRNLAPVSLDSSLHSTKIRHMTDILLRWDREHPDEKVLIVSQWTSFLQLISRHLHKFDIAHVQYRGDMTPSERERAVEVINSDMRVRCMLASRACGGVGLNLTCCNRVICMDLAWSEAVEDQLWSRVHRLGQTREVFVERLVIGETIEDRILSMQQKKRFLADGSLGDDGGLPSERLSMMELTALFDVTLLRQRS